MAEEPGGAGRSAAFDVCGTTWVEGAAAAEVPLRSIEALKRGSARGSRRGAGFGCGFKRHHAAAAAAMAWWDSGREFSRSEGGGRALMLRRAPVPTRALNPKPKNDPILTLLEGPDENGQKETAIGSTMKRSNSSDGLDVHAQHT